MDVLRLCKQLKNMMKFLLLSIKHDKTITVPEIYAFLVIINRLIIKICIMVDKHY